MMGGATCHVVSHFRSSDRVKEVSPYSTPMTTIYGERGSDWSHHVSAVGTTRWLQTLSLSVKGMACKTREASVTV